MVRAGDHICRPVGGISRLWCREGTGGGAAGKEGSEKGSRSGGGVRGRRDVRRDTGSEQPQWVGKGTWR